VLSLEPFNLKALLRRASARYSTDAFQAAASDVERILSLDPENKQALQLKDLLPDDVLNGQKPAPKELVPVDHAYVSKAEKEVNSRVEEFIDVEKLKITAQQYLADGLYDKVIALLAQYLRSIDIGPFSLLMKGDQTSLLHLLAAAYSSHADHSHAIATYERILQIDSTNFRAMLKRADSQLKLAVEVTLSHTFEDSLIV